MMPIVERYQLRLDEVSRCEAFARGAGLREQRATDVDWRRRCRQSRLQWERRAAAALRSLIVTLEETEGIPGSLVDFVLEQRRDFGAINPIESLSMRRGTVMVAPRAAA